MSESVFAGTKKKKEKNIKSKELFDFKTFKISNLTPIYPVSTHEIVSKIDNKIILR